MLCSTTLMPPDENDVAICSEWILSRITSGAVLSGSGAYLFIIKPMVRTFCSRTNTLDVRTSWRTKWVWARLVARKTPNMLWKLIILSDYRPPPY